MLAGQGWQIQIHIKYLFLCRSYNLHLGRVSMVIVLSLTGWQTECQLMGVAWIVLVKWTSMFLSPPQASNFFPWPWPLTNIYIISTRKKYFQKTLPGRKATRWRTSCLFYLQWWPTPLVLGCNAESLKICSHRIYKYSFSGVKSPD
jgi:hypothetical protein